MLQKVEQKFGINAQELHRFVKFAMVGLTGTVVDFGIFNMMRLVFSWFLGTGAPNSLIITIAATISFVAAIFNNFIFNRYWTYPDSRSKPLVGQFIQFAAVSLAGIVIRVPIVWLTHSWFAQLLTRLWPTLAPETANVLGDNAALVLAVAIVMFWNFFVNRYWTYSDVDAG